MSSETPAAAIPQMLSQRARARIRRLGRAFVAPALGLATALAPLPLAASEWPTATPAEVGFAPDLAERLDAALADPANAGLHAVVLVRDGRLVYERYLTGDDEIWGRRKQGVVFGPDSLHDVRSISKSVVGLLYGIALAEGRVPPPDAPVLASFPEYADLAADPARAAITVETALTMTMGTEWDENIPYSDPANSEIAMNRAPDSLRFVLDRPLVTTPGTDWSYNGGATEALAALIARGNDGDFLGYLESRLLTPLGIDRYEWITDYYGVPHAASGLRLRPRDTARIGQLVLDRGSRAGAQVVPADWIDASVGAGVPADYGCDYGRQWWLCPLPSGRRVIEGAGWGGQSLLLLPDLGIVFAANAGLYGDPEAWAPAYRLLDDIIVPALR
jgi:CubicO group peptidase (beta-lactamase class C family)